MPLSAVDFIPKGPIRSADIKQFVDLFTGVMLDQPITFRNTVAVGGNQGQTQAALSLYAAVNQTSNLINLYPSPSSLNPTFGFAASGAFGWGPGGNLVQDTFLSRIGTQNGHATDTAGLLLQPNIEVTGSIICDGPISFPTGGQIVDGGTQSISISQDLDVSRNLYLGTDRTDRLWQVRAGAIGLTDTLLIHGADATGTGLTAATAHLQVRSDDVPDAAGVWATAFSAYTFGASNWDQFNVKFLRQTPGIGWPGVALLLDYDVDAAGNIGGRIAMMNGKIGLGGVPTGGGDALQVYGNQTTSGNLTVTGTSVVFGAFTADATLAVAGTSTFTGNMALGNNLTVAGRINAVSQVFSSASNSPGAVLAFSQAVGPKICLYDSSPGLFFGMGINSSEMYLCTPAGATLTFRVNNGGGALLATFDTTNGNVTFGQPPSTTPQVVISPDNPSITFVTPTDPQGGGQQLRNIKVSSRPASQVGGGEVQIDLRLYVDGDITAGTYVHGISFMTTSNPDLKTNATILPDDQCMTRVRGALPVYTYQIAPPISGSVPTPTPTDIGFMATDVYAVVPEFAALDQNNAPVSVVYGQMASLLWGALRNLDSRCQAHGI